MSDSFHWVITDNCFECRPSSESNWNNAIEQISSEWFYSAIRGKISRREFSRSFHHFFLLTFITFITFSKTPTLLHRFSFIEKNALPKFDLTNVFKSFLFFQNTLTNAFFAITRKLPSRFESCSFVFDVNKLSKVYKCMILITTYYNIRI